MGRLYGIVRQPPNNGVNSCLDDGPAKAIVVARDMVERDGCQYQLSFLWTRLAGTGVFWGLLCRVWETGLLLLLLLLLWVQDGIGLDQVVHVCMTSCTIVGIVKVKGQKGPGLRKATAHALKHG
jgi:hypothetical protein